jgi:hypothetical protein
MQNIIMTDENEETEAKIREANAGFFGRMDGKGDCPECSKSAKKTVMQLDPKYQAISLRLGKTKPQYYMHAGCFRKLNKRLAEQERNETIKKGLAEIRELEASVVECTLGTDFTEIERKITGGETLTKKEETRFWKELTRLKQLERMYCPQRDSPNEREILVERAANKRQKRA